jgi:hypothetical protein
MAVVTMKKFFLSFLICSVSIVRPPLSMRDEEEDHLIHVLSRAIAGWWTLNSASNTLTAILKLRSKLSFAIKVLWMSILFGLLNRRETLIRPKNQIIKRELLDTLGFVRSACETTATSNPNAPGTSLQ